MAHFTIELPENKNCDVNRFDVINARVTDILRIERKSAVVESSSEPVYTFKAFQYIVTVSDHESSKEYCLFRFVNGEWFTDYEGKIQLEDDELLVIKDAIINREKELNTI